MAKVDARCVDEGDVVWKEFVQGIKEDDLVTFKKILSVSGRSHFLRRQIKGTQGTLNVLHFAVKYDAKKVVEYLLSIKPSLLNATTTPHNCTALHIAIDKKNDEIAEFLLDCKGVEINALDAYKHTPLKLATEKKNVRLVERLLDEGADALSQDSVKNTPIHTAARNGDLNILLLLMKSLGTRVSGITGRLNIDRYSPLHFAVESNSLECVALLMLNGGYFSLELRTRHEERPMDLAKGNDEMCDVLNNPFKAEKLLKGRV